METTHQNGYEASAASLGVTKQKEGGKKEWREGEGTEVDKIMKDLSFP